MDAGIDTKGGKGSWSMTSQSSQLNALGRTLRAVRRELDLSQEALGARAGLSAQHISQIERGGKDPRLSTVLRLADALGLRAGELFAMYDRRVDSPDRQSFGRPPFRSPGES